MSNGTPKKPSNQDHPPQLPTELLGMFLENQSKEIENKSQELEIQKINEEHGFEYSRAALKAESEDRKEHRDFIRKIRRDRYRFFSIAILIIAALLLYALHLGKDQIVMEVIKAIIFLLSGGAGGYALGKTHTPQTEKNQD